MPLSIANARNKMMVWGEIGVEYQHFIAQYNVSPDEFQFYSPSADWLNGLRAGSMLTVYLRQSAHNRYIVYLMGVPADGGPRLRGAVGWLTLH